MQKNIILIITACLTMCFSSCRKDIDKSSEQPGSIKSIPEYGEPAEQMILGRKLQNAYSVTYMQAAYDTLCIKSRLNQLPYPINIGLQIRTTHLYIRFLPQNISEYDYLIDQSGLELFAYPLDYEIVQPGLYYIDPSITPEEMTWLYTVISVKDAGNITLPYEILDYCFIPDDPSSPGGTIEEETLILLELEALRITGNITEEEYNEGVGTRGGAKPQGYIRVRNNSPNNNVLEGVKKVKVRVHNIVKWDAAYTDEIGYYKMSKKYLTNVHYAVIYENATGFKVWGNFAFLAPAHYDLGINSKSGYSRNIETNSDAWLWSTVNNAAYIYREKMCPNLNVTKPASNLRLWTVRMGGNWTGCAPMAHRFSLASATLANFLGVFSVTSKLFYITSVMPDVFIIKKLYRYQRLLCHRFS